MVVSAVNWPGILKEFHSETSGFFSEIGREEKDGEMFKF